MVLDDARVSWRHATISWGGRSWVVEDHGSTNGTFVRGQRIHQMEIGPGSSVHLGNATDGPRLDISAAAAAVASPQAQPQQQPYAAQGAGPGWAAAPPQQAPQQQAPPQQVPQQQAPHPGWQQPQQGAAPQVPQQQGPGEVYAQQVPGGGAGRRRSTATAARPRSTSSRWAV